MIIQTRLGESKDGKLTDACGSLTRWSICVEQGSTPFAEKARRNTFQSPNCEGRTQSHGHAMRVIRPYPSMANIRVLCCFKSFGSKGIKVEFFLVLHALPSDPSQIPVCRGKDGRRRFSAGSSLAPFQLRCPSRCHPSPNYLIRPVAESPMVRNGTLRPILVLWKIRKTFASLKNDWLPTVWF
jgi:hypothetical protein